MPEITLQKVFATAPRTVRGMPIVLGGHPKEKNFLYTNGKNVIIRDLENPETDSVIICRHAVDVYCARYAPSGNYIASGDANGKVMIWDALQPEHKLWKEYQPLSGLVKDLAWDGDSKRIAAVGEGRSKLGHVFFADEGNAAGTIGGHSKTINSVDIKHQRPMRLITASEDFSLYFHEGPPFKPLNHLYGKHSNFVNAVRYHPQGECFISASADGKCLVFDGKSGDQIGELGSPAHKGGVYALSFNRDGSKVITCSADKTVKMWDVASRSLLTTFNMGSTILDMQVGCLWVGDHIISVSLSGFINFLDVNNPDTPLRVLQGTNKQVTSLAVTDDYSTVFFGDGDQYITCLNPNTFTSERLQFKGHTNLVTDMSIDGQTLVSVSVDDTVMFTDTQSKQKIDVMKTSSQPRAVAAKKGTAVVACIGHVMVFKDGKLQFSQAVNFEPLSVAISPNGDVAVGGEKDKNIHIYNIASGALTEVKSFSAQGMDKQLDAPAVCLRFSPDGRYLTAGLASKYNVTFDTSNYEQVHRNQKHTGRITCVSWSPDSKYFVSGSIDGSVNVWDVTQKIPCIASENVHIKGMVNKVEWISQNEFLTAGADGCIKKWILS